MCTGGVPVFEGDSPIDLNIASVLEGVQVCALGAKHYWQEALVRAFLMEEPLKIFLVGARVYLIRNVLPYFQPSHLQRFELAS